MSFHRLWAGARASRWECSGGYTGPSSATFPAISPSGSRCFKEANGLSWKALARALGVRPCRLRRWRMHGVAPSSARLFALLTLAECMGLRDGVLMCRERDLPEAMELKALRN